MEQIRNLEQLVESLQGQVLRRLVIAAGHDRCTIRAAAEAADKGIAEVILVGQAQQIKEICQSLGGAFSRSDTSGTKPVYLYKLYCKYHL